MPTSFQTVSDEGRQVTHLFFLGHLYHTLISIGQAI